MKTNYSELVLKMNKKLSEIDSVDLAKMLASYGMEFETFECQECGLDTPKYMRYADSNICQGCGNCA